MDEIIEELIIFLKTRGFLGENISVDNHDSLTETGVIDSIIMLELVDFLERKYNIEIPMNMLTAQNFDTLASISDTIKKLNQ
jgi:acyl carrier protein